VRETHCRELRHGITLNGPDVIPTGAWATQLPALSCREQQRWEDDHDPLDKVYNEDFSMAASDKIALGCTLFLSKAE
jgi:hypothetical protein